MMVIILSLFTVSCSLNTRFKPKGPIQVPDNWHEHDKRFVASQVNPACFVWWTRFHDPMLENLIATGLQQNNNIQVARANIEAAQGELKRIKLNWIPSIGSNVGYSSFPYLGYPGVIVTAIPTYTLNILSQIKEQQRAKYELRITRNMRDTVKLTVITQIAINYFGYLAQKERLSLLQQVELDLSQSIKIYQAAYHGGLSAAIDLDKLKSSLSTVQSQEMIIRKNIVIHQNAIRYLLNQNPHDLPETYPFSHLDTQRLVVGTLPIQVLESRPDMMQATQALKAANAGVEIAFSHFLPSIQLSLARGDIATVPNGGTLGLPVHFNQALLQAPILTLSTLGEWDKAKALSKASYFRYQDTLRRVLREVNDDLAAHEYFSERLAHTVVAEKQYAASYQLNQQLYKNGIMSYLDLLDEKVRLDKIKIKVNEHKLDQLMTIVHLYQDLAAGYGCIDAQPPHSEVR